MSRSTITASFAAVLFALATAFLFTPDGPANLLFHVKSRSSVRRDLERTVDAFNKLYASFYVTGGNSPGLNVFPAANLVKRRIFQDINLWQQEGQWLIHDLHAQEFRRAELLSPGWAVVETRETWDLWLRDIQSGRKTARRTSEIQVRYHLARKGARWIVPEFEVFGKNEGLPPMSEHLL